MPKSDACASCRILTAAAVLLAAGVAAPATAAEVMSVTQAQARAVRILKGDPYGKTEAEIVRRIRRGELQHSGRTVCGPITRPVWTFHVVVLAAENMITGNRIGGMLALDAVTGKLVCTNLPMLD